MLGAVLAVAPGCDWSVFDELEAQASTVVLEMPDEYPRGGFGSQLASYEGGSGTTKVSRLAVNAGAGTPPKIFGVWNGTGVDLGNELQSLCEGGSGGMCSMEAGAGLAGTAFGATGDPCLLVGEPDLGQISVKCESEQMRGITTALTPGERFAAAIAPLPDTIATAVVGAPGAAGGGRLYTVRQTSVLAISAPTVINGLDATRMAGGNLGNRIATAPSAAGAMLATSSRLGTSGRVVWASLTAADTATVLACIDDATSPVLGTSMTLGRLTGDATPDLAVGVTDPAGMPDRTGRVAVYDGSMVPGACSAPAGAPIFVTCPDGLGGVDCAGSGFGAALAVGDVDADGDDDLVIGAPLATVDGLREAGAVYVVAGPLTSAPAAADFRVMTDSSPDQDARLGATLATIRTFLDRPTPRAEIAAGAPGNDEVYVFLCSGLGTDTPAIGQRCLPTM